ncbi:MAG: M20 family metallopeptidase [Ignavibacteriales bacterium]
MSEERYRSLSDSVREQDVVAICRDLIRFNTVNPPGNEGPAAEYVGDYLRRAGLDVRNLRHSDARASVMATLKGRGGAGALMYNGHLDVVPEGAQPWSHDPFAGDVAGGRVWGRGASDMKSGIAAMMVAARTLAEADLPLQGDLIVTATAGEEVNMLGAREVVSLPGLDRLQAIVLSEPTGNEIGIAERGLLWLEVETHGKTAHGSTPHLGRNAILMMMPLLQELDHLDIPYENHPLLGDFTRSINTIHGGVKTNVVPDSCIATVDFRTVPGQSHTALRGLVEDLIAHLERDLPSFKASVRVNSDLSAVETDPSSEVVQRFAGIVAGVTGRRPVLGAVPFATEAAVFVPALGTPTVVFGPGEPALAHQPDEYVDIAKMVDAARVLTLAAASLLSG